MKQFYYYLYFRIYYFLIGISDDALNEIKPGATIIVLEILVITQLFIWLRLLKILSTVNEDFLWSKPFLIIIVLLLVVFNYFVFLYEEKWKKYDNEFNSFCKRKKRRWNFLIIVLILVILIGFIMSFYLFYQA